MTTFADKFIPDKPLTTDPPGRPTRISQLVAGQKLFDSSGYTTLMTTKEGKEEPLELPIKSTGVSEFMDELSGKAPQPPVRRELIKKDSKEGRALGLPHDRMVQVFDNTDEDYINALERHNQDFSWRVVIFALDIDWKKQDGSPAVTFEEKKEVLKTNNITMNHIDRIVLDVQNLTRLKEDQDDFLSAT